MVLSPTSDTNDKKASILSTSNMFAAQPAVSGFCPYNSPSSRCLQTSANSPGLKGCRGRAQLNALPTLHFLAKPVQWDFGVKCHFFSAFQLLLPPFFLTQVRSVIRYQVFCPRSLCHHAFPSQFFFLATVLVHKHASKTVMFGCYQPQVMALFWHGITNPLIITALCRSALKEMGFRFTVCLWQAGTRPLEPQVWWHSI